MNIKLQAKRLLFEGDSCVFDGTITVDIPPHHERTKLMAKTLEGFKQEDLSDDKAKDQPVADKLERVRFMADAAAKISADVYKRVKECDLKANDGSGEVITDKETLWAHPDCLPLVEGLVAKFMTNFAGNKNAT